MRASRPAPGVGPTGSVVDEVVGTMVVVVPIGADPGRHTSLYLSLSVPFVVEAFALMRTSPFSTPPFLLMTTGTTTSMGAAHAAALAGSRPATAASKPAVSIVFFLFLPLKRIVRTTAGVHFGSAGSL
jgi:hypothetical protein